MLAVGCQPEAKPARSRGPVAQADVKDALFNSVVENLDRLEEFDISQMMPQICDRLNQWHLQEKPSVEWRPDPLIEQLPSELRELRVMKTLDHVQYRIPDAWYLQETVWLRDVSRGARGDQFDDVAVAERLFDWTIRNVQLEPDVDPATAANRHRPFETLLLGRGDAQERAWVFILLARQQGLDVVQLAIDEGEGKPPRPWLPALLSGGELYLFDTRLGLPIPAADGRGIATLAQVAADPELLRRLDLDAEHPYPVQPDDLQHVVALVEASPQSLSRRMALVESRLAGERKMVLTSPGSELAERVKKVPHVTGARLWARPFDIWLWQSKLTQVEALAAAREMSVFQAMPSLMTGRALYFKGVYEGDKGAKVNLMNSRLDDRSIEDFRLPEEIARQIRREEISQQEAARIVMLRHAKQDASFWLGLVCFEQEQYPAAVDFFAKRTLEATPDGPWTPSARYNLARTYEALGRTDEAIALYEADDSPQSHGNKLRARRLRDGAAQAAAE
ncbi:MAG: tetratricopeptide repeat protein [Pirellulales bacterium]